MKKILYVIILASLLLIACRKNKEQTVEQINNEISNRINKRWLYYAAKFSNDKDTTYPNPAVKVVTTFKKTDIYSVDYVTKTYDEDSILTIKETNSYKGTWQIQNKNTLIIQSKYYTYTYGYDSLGNYVITDSVLKTNIRIQQVIELHDSILILKELLDIDDTTIDVIYFYKEFKY